MAPESLFSVYVVIDDSYLSPSQFGEAALAVADGGATVLQFRSARLGDAERLLAIRDILEVSRERGIHLMINDRVDLVLAAGAAGVHLGVGDIPIDIARRILGRGTIIGGTAHSSQEAVLAEEKGADYVSAGCIFPSRTKPGLTPAGTKLIEDIVRSVKIPVVAIGGITPENAREAIEVGASGVASISYVWQSADWRKAVGELAVAVSEQKLKIKDQKSKTHIKNF